MSHIFCFSSTFQMGMELAGAHQFAAFGVPKKVLVSVISTPPLFLVSRLRLAIAGWLPSALPRNRKRNSTLEGTGLMPHWPIFHIA